MINAGRPKFERTEYYKGDGKNDRGRDMEWNGGDYFMSNIR